MSAPYPSDLAVDTRKAVESPLAAPEVVETKRDGASQTSAKGGRGGRTKLKTVRYGERGIDSY